MPSRHCVRALTADEVFLAQRGEGRVEQVFSRAVNLFLPQQQRLLTLLCESSDNAPNSCRLALTQCNHLFRPGEQVRFTASGIAVGENTWIELATCQPWKMPEWFLNAAHYRAIPWQRWAHRLHAQLGNDDTLFLYTGDNPFYRELARELQLRRQKLTAALQQRRNIASAVKPLLGLGIGLTPSSDDYLVGLSIILFIRGHPLEKYREHFLSAIKSDGNNTTLLSKITLEEALQRRYRESIARLVEHILSSPDDYCTHLITDIKNIGSSSGCDMLYGMADACALSHWSGGSYASQDSC